MSNEDVMQRAGLGLPKPRMDPLAERPRRPCPGFVNAHIDPMPARCILNTNHDGDCA